MGIERRAYAVITTCLITLSFQVNNRVLWGQTSTTTGSMITARYDHSALSLMNGSVLIEGGVGIGNVTLSSAEIYSPSTGKFASTGSLNTPRAFHSSILLSNGSVLVVGGFDNTSKLTAVAEIYNPATGVFTKTGAMNAARNNISPVLLPNGQVLVVGGADQQNNPLATAELYTPSTGQWTYTGHLNVGRNGASCTLLNNGTVLVVGGSIQSTGSNPPATNTAEIFNPATGTFSYTGSGTGTGSSPDSVVKLNDGTVLFGEQAIVKLQTCSGRGCHSTWGISGYTPGERFDPATSSFAAGPTFMRGKFSVLNDGNVLVLGDESDTPDTGFQIYSTGTGVVSTAGKAILERGDTATVTPLLTGGALIAGGTNVNGILAEAEIYADPGVTGIIHPKYVVVGVTYAPPGPASSVTYTNSVTVGSTSSLANSFSSKEELSISVGSNAGVSGWLNGSVTGTSTTSFTQLQSSSNAVSLSDQATLAFTTPGVPTAFSPVNHDYDIIWLWLNPIVILTANPNTPNALTWNGYGFDAADQPTLDIWPIYVGYLNGHFGALDPEDAKVLARSWSTGQTFPQSGQNPALNQADYAEILKADPFTSASYSVVLLGSDPTTTTDGRFTLSGGPTGQSQSFPYKQPPPGQQPISATYQNIYTNETSLGRSSTLTTQQAFSVDAKFDGGFFFASVTYELKYTGTLIWTVEAQNTIMNTQTKTDSLTITGPSCSGSPCNPLYTSPAEFDVYQDNLYGTFMFNPVN